MILYNYNYINNSATVVVLLLDRFQELHLNTQTPHPKSEIK